MVVCCSDLGVGVEGGSCPTDVSLAKHAGQGVKPGPHAALGVAGHLTVWEEG